MTGTRLQARSPTGPPVLRVLQLRARVSHLEGAWAREEGGAAQGHRPLGARAPSVALWPRVRRVGGSSPSPTPGGQPHTVVRPQVADRVVQADGLRVVLAGLQHVLLLPQRVQTLHGDKHEVGGQRVSQQHKETNCWRQSTQARRLEGNRRRLEGNRRRLEGSPEGQSKKKLSVLSCVRLTAVAAQCGVSLFRGSPTCRLVLAKRKSSAWVQLNLVALTITSKGETCLASMAAPAMVWV